MCPSSPSIPPPPNTTTQYWKEDGDRSQYVRSRSLGPNYEGLINNSFRPADMAPERLRPGQPQINVSVTRFENSVVQVDIAPSDDPLVQDGPLRSTEYAPSALYSFTLTRSEPFQRLLSLREETTFVGLVKRFFNRARSMSLAQLIDIHEACRQTLYVCLGGSVCFSSVCFSPACCLGRVLHVSV